MILDNKLETILISEGYFNLKYIINIGLCGLYRFAFTTGLIININNIGYDGRYCYSTLADAKEALEKWDGTNDPSGPWIKYKGIKGERRNDKNH